MLDEEDVFKIFFRNVMIFRMCRIGVWGKCLCFKGIVFFVFNLIDCGCGYFLVILI